MFRNNLQKAAALKTQVRQLVNADLAKVTHDENATMPWKNYNDEIELKKGLRLVGWDENALGPIRNPSLLSSSLPPLNALLRDLKSGECRFEAIPRAEWRKIRQEAKEKDVRKRKRRSDMGRKRGPRKLSVHKSKRTIEESSDEEGEGEDGEEEGRSNDEEDDDEDEDQKDQEQDEDESRPALEEDEDELGPALEEDETLGGTEGSTSSNQGKFCIYLEFHV